MRTTIRIILIAILLLILLGRFVPPDLSNPPINPAATFEAVAKPNPAAAAVLQRACYDCHSNRTVWPWYSRVAPASWLVAGDVKEGRAHLNLSEWANYGSEMAAEKLRGICNEAKSGAMPLWQYRLIHPQARLSADDVNALCAPTAAGTAAAVRR